MRPFSTLSTPLPASGTTPLDAALGTAVLRALEEKN
jgi:hypothetical protein